jgi:hypothetical protein
LFEIVLEQPRLGQQRPDRQIIVSGEAPRAKGGSEKTRSLQSIAALERGACSRD